MIIFLLSKMLFALMRYFNLGATTFPGKFALTFNPNILSRLSKNVQVIIITGTNGKTTSARIIEEGIKRSGKSYFINRSGANLITGITTAFLINCNIFGKCKKEYAIIECDENAFVKVSKYINAHTVLVTNVFRDQLDRYGEVSHTLEVIRKSLDNMPNAIPVINCDCSMTHTLKRNNCVSYGVSYPANIEVKPLDGTYCLYCGHKLDFDYHTYSHLGAYHCTNCDYQRGTPDFEVTDVFSQGAEYSDIVIDNSIFAHIPIGGIYNVYNAVGAYAALITLGVDKKYALDGLEHFAGAFGRMESFGNIKMILVKNPAGLDLACKYIDMIRGEKTIIFSLNDNDADGRDVSWIWDSDIVAKGDVYAHGKRSADMALRLKYANINCKITDDIIATVKSANGNVFVVPTYTSMMSMRPKFIKEFGGKEFWA